MILRSFLIAQPLIAMTIMIQAIRKVTKPIATVNTNIASISFNSIARTVSWLCREIRRIQQVSVTTDLHWP